jgi:indolepyruvate ferredoxin oxidoreductase alpha subunit
MTGSFTTRENLRPAFTLRQALDTPRRDLSRIVLPPASFQHEREKIEQRWPAAVQFITERKLNEVIGGELDHIGIVMLGGLYNNVQRALERLDLGDRWGATRVPLYLQNVAYPLIDDELVRFCRGKRAVLVVEEGQPDYHEQALHAILRRHGVDTALHGKDLLPKAGDYTVQALIDGVRGFMERVHPAALAKPVSLGMPQKTASTAATDIVALLPPRAPGLCIGCPERPIFSSLNLVERELGKHHVSADIGCHLFSIMPPFNLGATTMGYGLGASSASAFNAGQRFGTGKRAIAFMGDGGFWHNGLTSGIGNAVFNQHDNVFVVVDNNYSAATGGQDIPSSRSANANRSTMHAIESAVRGVGVEWVRMVDRTYDVTAMKAALHDALTSEHKGPKVVIAQSECMLNRQRREKPAAAAAVKRGERVVKERFGVDAATCSGDHACMRLSGCPSLTLAPSGDALKPDPVAHVDEHCVACGHCGEVADAAVLCPSFYKAHTVRNPSGWERARARLRDTLLGWLRRREQRQRAKRALYPLEA